MQTFLPIGTANRLGSEQASRLPDVSSESRPLTKNRILIDLQKVTWIKQLLETDCNVH